eukprot:scaffold505551_cov42-Prasinocladus_malaysianus.AAC.1
MQGLAFLAGRMTATILPMSAVLAPSGAPASERRRRRGPTASSKSLLQSSSSYSGSSANFL